MIMLIKGRPFTVSTERFDNLRRMHASVGNTPLLTEFRPVRFPYGDDVYQLLFKCFYSQGISCFLAGQYVLYMAGIFQTFNAASLFIATTNAHFLQLLFRLSPEPTLTFSTSKNSSSYLWKQTMKTIFLLQYLARPI